MTEPATGAATTATHHVGNAFTKKAGPFPLWAWGLIAGGLIIGYRVLNSRNAPTSADVAADPSTTDGQDIATLTGAGPQGVGGFFVPVDSFGKAPNIPTTGPKHPALAKWVAYKRAHPKPPIRHFTHERTTERELARQYFGSPVFWQLIHNANRDRLAHPGNIPAGTTVLIPQQ